MPRQKKLNGDKPATQHDLSLLSGHMTTRLDRLEGKVDKLETGQKELKEDVSSLKRSQEAILNVVQSIDTQLQEHKTHPTRIRRLERSVFR